MSDNCEAWDTLCYTKSKYTTSKYQTKYRVSQKKYGVGKCNIQEMVQHNNAIFSDIINETFI